MWGAEEGPLAESHPFSLPCPSEFPSIKGGNTTIVPDAAALERPRGSFKTSPNLCTQEVSPSWKHGEHHSLHVLEGHLLAGPSGRDGDVDVEGSEAQQHLRLGLHPEALPDHIIAALGEEGAAEGAGRGRASLGPPCGSFCHLLLEILPTLPP